MLARDWIIHPLQLVEAKEAGAAGVLGVIGQVNGRGTAVMSSFGAALGLDCPVEVVNARVGTCKLQQAKQRVAGIHGTQVGRADQLLSCHELRLSCEKPPVQCSRQLTVRKQPCMRRLPLCTSVCLPEHYV